MKHDQIEIESRRFDFRRRQQ